MQAEADRLARLPELELLEIAPQGDGLAQELAARLSRQLGLPCRIAPAPEELEVPELPSRNQVDADRLLALVEGLEPAPRGVRVALTGRDMGHPIFTHFFGRARRGGRAVLVSTARLDPRFAGLAADPAVVVRRAALEVLHELGHVAGLGHCQSWDCVMRFASTVEALDNRGGGFCASCAAQLPPSLARVRA